ncbi:MAG TPA: hypothetical protein VFF37_12505 [Streptomyces sp.]|nr:hypothetical protein [Streptomyces sp.]
MKRNPKVTAAGRTLGIRRGLVVTAVVGGMLLAVSGCRSADVADAKPSGGGTSAGTSAQEEGSAKEDTAKGSAGGSDLRVTGVALAVVPTTLSAVKCNTAVPESYMAVISLSTGHEGGEITFRYGAASGAMKEETMTVPAGRTSVTKSFFYSEYVISNSLAAAQVTVVKPNFVASSTVHPTGTCNQSGFWDSSTTAGVTGGY